MASVSRDLDFQQIPNTAPRDFVEKEVDGRFFPRIIGTEAMIDEKTQRVVRMEE